MNNKRRIKKVDESGILKIGKNEYIQVRPNYSYDIQQIKWMVKSQKFFGSLCDDKNHYRTSEIIISNNDQSPNFNKKTYANPKAYQMSNFFKIQKYKDKIFYHSTLEYGYYTGIHSHILLTMNNCSNNTLYTLKDDLEKWLGNDMQIQIMPRKSDYRLFNHGVCTYFHNLNYEYEIKDCIERGSYLCKYDDKEKVNAYLKFSGSRDLKPLKEIQDNATRLKNTFIKAEKAININILH